MSVFRWETLVAMPTTLGTRLDAAVAVEMTTGRMATTEDDESVGGRNVHESPMGASDSARAIESLETEMAEPGKLLMHKENYLHQCGVCRS